MNAPVAHLSLLGTFELRVDEDVHPLPLAAQRLLAFLAVHGRSRATQRATLAERLWCDTPPARAAANLRSALWRLPRMPGRTLVTTTPVAVQLSSHVQVDLWHGERQIESLAGGTACPPDLEQVVGLTGLLLPDWDEEWLDAERERYRQACLHALDDACTALRAAGRNSAALQAGLAAVRCEPLRESAHRLVVEVHLQEGNHAEALRHYHRFRRLLADELGLAPSPAMHRLVTPLLGRPIDSPGPGGTAGGSAGGMPERNVAYPGNGHIRARSPSGIRSLRP